jgi:hypothetical protein
MKYQITLAVEGNHSVSVIGEDEAEMTLGLVWSKKIHQQLRALSKREPASPSPMAPATQPGATELPPGPPPLCGLHQVAMIWQRGRRGHFWSCHERLPDGRWCPFKPITPPGAREEGAYEA